MESSPERFFIDTPLKLAASSVQGRFVVAKRKIRQGEILMIAEPFAFSVTESRKSKICHHCYAVKSEPLEFCCSECRSVWFCSDACFTASQQNEHPHKGAECRAFKQLLSVIDESDDWTGVVRIVLRALLRLAHETGVVTDLTPPSDKMRYQDFANLVSNISTFDSTFLDIFTICREQVMSALPDGLEMDRDEVLELFAKESCNSFGIWDSADTCLGVGVYPSASFFNHACYPNAVKCQQLGTTQVTFRALRDIEEGEEVSITYIDLDKSTDDRKAYLQCSYFFECACQRCQDNTGKFEADVFAGICPKRCGGFLYSPDTEGLQPRKCNYCGVQEPPALD